MLFNIALNYGGRAEIVEAVRRVLARGGAARTSSTSSGSPAFSTRPGNRIPTC